MMRDPVINVKDTVAWTLGRVSDVLVDCINPDVHLHGLISALVLGLQDNPRIVSNCCWVRTFMTILYWKYPNEFDNTVDTNKLDWFSSL